MKAEDYSVGENLDYKARGPFLEQLVDFEITLVDSPLPPSEKLPAGTMPLDVFNNFGLTWVENFNRLPGDFSNISFLSSSASVDNFL